MMDHFQYAFEHANLFVRTQLDQHHNHQLLTVNM
jgi:hypothetical protein